MRMRALAAAATALALLSSACAGLPDGLNVSVSPNGCAPDGTCPYGGRAPANFYWAPTRTIVLAPGQGDFQLFHEGCHAHQHWSILEETGEEPADPDLSEWHGTVEGRSFAAATAAEPHPWSWISQADVAMEDFANTCAKWLLDPGWLRDRAPARAAWAEEWLR